MRPDEPGPTIRDLMDRRRFLEAGGAVALLSLLDAPRVLARRAGTGPVRLGFEPIDMSSEDVVRVPKGYSADVLYAWGDPVSDGPAWAPDAGQDHIAQERQAGTHHDGMEYFPLAPTEKWRQRGLLAVNHEYPDNGLLFTDGTKDWSAAKVAKSQASLGVSIIEVGFDGKGWHVVRPSRYGRRIHANTPMRAAGPAAKRLGEDIRGTFANCAAGRTPWGTYLTCEENFHDYFAWSGDPAKRTSRQVRYGVGDNSAYAWEAFDERYDATRNPHVAEHHGWVVEIDPEAPAATPVKHTALGRFRHENAGTTLTKDGRVVVYMGDDARFEYVYKYVSRGSYDPRKSKRENSALLDDGTLHVARFEENGKGSWIPLDHAEEALGGHFEDQADLVTHARMAGDVVGATKMDRPEWLVVREPLEPGDPREVYCSLTNNDQRGKGGNPGPDAANPRIDNQYGAIVRWTENGDSDATSFTWSFFLMGGAAGVEPAAQFGSPDGLLVDPNGLLWIQTDYSSSLWNRGPYAGFGNNQMLVADPATGDVRRFLTGPVRCEVTGITMTPDARTLFINIQHPGEPDSGFGDPAAPLSRWPGGGETRPRSATVVIRKTDGGVIGT